MEDTNQQTPARIGASVATAGTPCKLGTDPAKFLENFEDWLDHHCLLAETIGVEDAKFMKVLLLWSGKDFRKFSKEAGVLDTDSRAAAIGKIRTRCGSHVNLSMAIFKLMHAKQGTKTFTEFSNEVDCLATQCQFEANPYDKDRAAKDALIFGTSDEKLRQEALAKDFNLSDLKKAALGYEQSRKSAGAIKNERQDEACSRVYTETELSEIVSRITAGKYSSQAHKSNNPTRNSSETKCPNCPPHYRQHAPQKCPAQHKTCVKCKQKGHFANSRSCGMTQPIRNISEGGNGASYNFEYEDDVVNCIETIHLLSNSAMRDQCTMVQVAINDTKMQMFVDSGCKRTLLPVSMYTKKMGPIKESSIKFRPYGTNVMLKCHGAVEARIATESGADHATQIYIIEGHMAEPLLGRQDALALGILSITKEGKHPSTSPESVNFIADDLRAAGICITTKVDTDDTVGPEAQRRIRQLVEKHSSLFNGIGLLKGEEVKFNIDRNVTPVADSFRGAPLAYRQRLSDHLQVLRDHDKIEDVDPSEHHGWISNVVITEKKSANQIRMNIDMRNPNKALTEYTKQHIETIHEIRHKLQGATRFSEMDLSHGYHQVALAEESRDISTFQTHEGLHRFKVLFFGASPATDLFHQRIKGSLAGLKGCTSIHDNIIVWGKDDAEHEENLSACLQRIGERGLTLRRKKMQLWKNQHLMVRPNILCFRHVSRPG